MVILEFLVQSIKFITLELVLRHSDSVIVVEMIDSLQLVYQKKLKIDNFNYFKNAMADGITRKINFPNTIAAVSLLSFELIFCDFLY